MDYEKAYKEALKDMRVIYSNLNGDAKLAVEHAFPELTESEDEKIIEEIKFAVMQMPSSREDTKQRCLAYLEKQKENPKSVDSIPSDCVLEAKCGDRSPKYSDSDGTDIRDTPAYWRGWDDAMKQKEQKPVEWSEEDGAKLGALINYFEGDALDYSTDDIVNWLKSLRPFWKPSEEQMEALKEFVDEARGIHNASMGGYTPYINLQSLYEQLKEIM